jgi:hypothetical protein
MRAPGTGVGEGRAPRCCLARWLGRGWVRPQVGSVHQRERAWPTAALGGSGGGAVSSMWWGGGEAPVRPALESPAALMDRPVMGSAEQGEVREVGRTAVQPVPEVMALAPGQGAGAVGKDTAAVPHTQCPTLAGWMTRLLRPTSRGWLGAPPRTRGNLALAARSRPARLPVTPGSSSQVVGRLTITRLTALSQASRRQASGSMESPQPSSPPRPQGGRAGCAGRPPRSAGAGHHRSWATGRLPGCGGPAR